MNKALTVAKWEYLEKIKSKAFLISIVLTPLIMIAFSVLPTLFANKADTDTKVIGIIDQSASVTRPLADILEKRYRLENGQPNYNLFVVPVRDGLDAAKDSADAMVLSKRIEGYLVIGPQIMIDTMVQYRSENVGNFRITERFSDAVREIVQTQKLRKYGLDSSIVKDLTSRLNFKTFKVVKKGEKEEEGGFQKVFILAYAFLMMMFFIVMTSGQLLVRSMLEEKSNRIVEVLVSSCSPTELMAGKIIGLSGLGLTQLALWGALALGFAGPVVATMFTPLTAVLFFLYFILGYLFYASVFVALGAPVSTEQEAQQLTSYLVMILILPVALVIPVVQNPDSTMARVLSYVPFLTPTMMALRMAVRIPNAIEIISTLAILGASAFGMMKAAGKIFRTTILLTGKKPSFAELMRIVKTP